MNFQKFKLSIFTLLFVSKLGVSAPLSKYEAPSHHEQMTGIGIQVGTMGGLSFYQDLDRDNFVQGVLGTFWYNGFYIAGDYCFQYPGAVKSAPALTPYVGIGPMMATGTTWRHDKSYTAIGVHIPLGINLKIPKVPMQIYLQVGPAMLLTPYTDTYMDAALGVRFMF